MVVILFRGLVVSFVIYSNAVTVPLAEKNLGNRIAPWDFQALVRVGCWIAKW